MQASCGSNICKVSTYLVWVWLFVGVQFVPAEKVVAAFQHHSTTVYATASTSSEAQVYLEALEKGTDGIVLQTDDPREVFAFMVH